MRAGSPPIAAIASRMAARSTTAGTPVKSWSRTRAGMNGTSASIARLRLPGGEGACLVLAHHAATGVAEHVLHQDLDGHRRRAKVGQAAAIEPVVV